MSQQRRVKGAAFLGVGTLALGVGQVLTAYPDDTAEQTSSGQEITPEVTAAEWTDEPIGFAALPGEGLDGTTGGAAGDRHRDNTGGAGRVRRGGGAVHHPGGRHHR